MSDLIRCKQIDWTDFPNVNDSNYIHVQQVPSNTWEINHELKKRPCVRVSDENKQEIYGDVEDVNNDMLVIRFINPTAGRAELN